MELRYFAMNSGDRVLRTHHIKQAARVEQVQEFKYVIHT